MKHPAKPHAIPTSPTPVAEGFIDKAQLAQRTMMSPRTLEDWMRQGRLPYYKLGRAVRFKWSEVEQHFTQTCRVGAGQAAENRTTHPNEDLTNPDSPRRNSASTKTNHETHRLRH